MKGTTIVLSPDEQLRLDECVKEPIRTPGSIQPHGALLALNPLTLVIGHASDNCGAVLGIEAGVVLGRPIDVVTGEDWASENWDTLLGLETSRNPMHITLGGRRLDVIVHSDGVWTFVEFEPSIVADDYQSSPSVYGAIQQLTKATTDHELWDAAARELKSLTMFDRVMIYHFHPDGHGEIVAEQVENDMEPYLGLHYPASDIPAQARELYLSKLSRMIVNSAGDTAALLSDPAVSDDPASGDPARLDLSSAELRSVSPHHLQFMRNMGQASTLSLSLVRGDQLIGMITLANRTVRRVPYALRQGLEILAAQISVQLSSMNEIRRLTQQMHLRSIRSQLVNQLSMTRTPQGPDIPAALFRGDLTLLDLVPAAGVILDLGSQATTLGTAPGIEAVREAVRLITPGSRGVIAIESLEHELPEVAHLLPGVAGMLLVPLVGGSGFLAWFRPEISQTITWLGDQTSANRVTTLSPRTSFSSWSQSVSGQSLPWAGLDTEAEELARDMISVMQRHAEAQLAALAMHDPLTGLPNRRHLMERLEIGVADPMAGSAMSLLFIDLDSFKGVNDTHGHDAGDAVLVHAAKQIRAATRTQDLVARLGGDEFVVMCAETTPEEAMVIAGRIVEAVKQPTYVAGRMIAITASVGIASTASASTAVDVLRDADGAMYRAKARGRDQTSV